MLCFDAEIYPKANMEPWWSDTSVFLRKDEQYFSGTTSCPNSEKCMGVLTDFKKKMQQTEVHPRHLNQVEVPVNSLLPNITDTKNAGRKIH